MSYKCECGYKTKWDHIASRHENKTGHKMNWSGDI